MNSRVLIWTCLASVLLRVKGKPIRGRSGKSEYHTAATTHHKNEVYGHRHNHRLETTLTSREVRKKKRQEEAQMLRKMIPEYDRFRDDLTTSEQVSRRPFFPHECRKAYVESKNYTRKSIVPEYLLCDSMYKREGLDVERAALESLERRFVRERKEREEKARREKTGEQHYESSTSGHHRIHEEDKHHTANSHHTGSPTQNRTPHQRNFNGGETIDFTYQKKNTYYEHPKYINDSSEMFTASSGLLDELGKYVKKHYTGDSKHYEEQYEEDYKNITHPPSLSDNVSENDQSFEDFYDSRMRKPYNYTTEHYPWWTYNSNESCHHYYNDMPLDYNRMLYSLKMSSILPPNISAEIDAEYNQKSIISSEYAEKCRQSREKWAEDVSKLKNSDRGPVTERRELYGNKEILVNRYEDKELEIASKFVKDVKTYVRKPIQKGLYHFKKWMNPKYFTTPTTKLWTWPDSMDDQEMIDLYKHYLKEEKNIDVPAHVQESVFSKYRFENDSNYYDEDTGDLPRHEDWEK